jgi:cell division protease FtsH
VNAARLRRLLGAVAASDAPPEGVLREATLGGLPLAAVDLDADIGGYAAVKQRLRRGLLDVLRARDAAASAEEVERIERLIPHGVVLWGPPGTGKSLFARAVATSLGAALVTVPGVELRALPAVEAAERLRSAFLRARQAAPAVVLVEGLDAIAPRRADAGAPSVLETLLAEMDALRPEAMVFVIATTAVMDSVDPALLRSGRFELDAFVGPPDAADRRAILEVHARRLGIELAPAALDFAVERTGDPLLAGGTPMTGDHLEAVARGLARDRLGDGGTGPVESAAVERVLTELLGRADLSPGEAETFAVHESGHALAAMILGQRVDRLVLGGDLGGAIATAAQAAVRRGTIGQGALTDAICVLLAGREAEDELGGEVSAVGARDLALAAQLARTAVGELGMGPALLPPGGGGVDAAARDFLHLQQERARQLLEEQRDALVALSQALLRREVLDREVLAALVKFEEPHAAGEPEAAADADSEADAE